MNLYLDAPEMMSEFEWPTIGPGSLIPPTESTIGKISWNNSETFIVHVGKTTKDDFKEYAKLCEAEGFTVDFSKTDEYFSAYNKDGYEITLRYLGYNRMEVSIKAPDETN